MLGMYGSLHYNGDRNIPVKKTAVGKQSWQRRHRRLFSVLCLIYGTEI